MSWFFLGARVGGRDITLSPLTTSGPIFLAGGVPWRWKGVSAFPLAAMFARGENIDPFLDAFAGFNLLRVWSYVTWPGTGWEPSDSATLLAFAEHCKTRGFYVELTLLTDDDPARIQPARDRVAFLSAHNPQNVVLEIGNEPTTHKSINTRALQAALTSGLLISSGDYEDSNRFFGSFLTAHTPRDGEWPRKAHDLLEYHNGGGPSAPSDPAHKVPVVADEPMRPDQAGFNVQDYRAYFGTCALLGAGGTFHYEGGKFGRLPTADEARCAAAALEGLNAFPADAPRGPYRRIDELGGSLRTYAVGNSMVRVRPLTTAAPEPGWTPIDGDGILWKR